VSEQEDFEFRLRFEQEQQPVRPMDAEIPGPGGTDGGVVPIQVPPGTTDGQMQDQLDGAQIAQNGYQDRGTILDRVKAKVQQRAYDSEIPIDLQAAQQMGIPTVEGREQAELAVEAARTAPLAGVTQGLRETGQGVKQLGMAMAQDIGQTIRQPGVTDENLLLSDEELDDYIQNVIGQREQFKQQYGGVPGIEMYRTMGKAAPYVGIPAGGPARLVATGAGIAGTEFAETPEQRKKAVQTGAVIGAAIPVAGKVIAPLAKPVTKLINAVRGKFGDAEAAKLEKLAAEHAVPISYGDITKGPLATKAETATEIIPVVGTGKFRQAQNVKARAAAEKVVGKLGKDLDSDDWVTIAQSSLSKQGKAVKAQATKHYDEVERLAETAGNVPTINLNKAAKEIIDEIKQKPEKFWTKTDREIMERAGNYLDDPNVSFSVIRQLRSDLGDEVSDFYTGANTLVGRKGVQGFQKLKRALEKDMQTFAEKRGGDMYKAWKRADLYYKKKVVPFQDTVIAKASKTDEPDRIYSLFIKRGRGDRARKFYNAMDEEGRAAIRYGMVDDAFRKATKEGKPFSPAKFAKSLEDIAEARDVFFKGVSKQEITGFAKLMRSVERSGHYAADEPTGKRVIPWLLAGGTFLLEPTALAVGGSVSLGIKVLFTTKAGRRLLLASSKAKPASPQMTKIIHQMNDYLVKAGAVSNLDQETNQPSPKKSKQSKRPLTEGTTIQMPQMAQ